VEGGDLRQQTAADSGGDSVTNLIRRSPPEGKDQYLARGLTFFQSSHHRLHNRGGLAGTRTRKDQERTFAMLHHHLLLGVQDRRLHPGQGREV
jgi:hypothetical protein